MGCILSLMLVAGFPCSGRSHHYLMMTNDLLAPCGPLDHLSGETRMTWTWNNLDSDRLWTPRSLYIPVALCVRKASANPFMRLCCQSLRVIHAIELVKVNLPLDFKSSQRIMAIVISFLFDGNSVVRWMTKWLMPKQQSACTNRPQSHCQHTKGY